MVVGARREPVMLVELGLVEQRYRAVLEVLDRLAVTEVARRYGVSRQTVHVWLRRYAAEGGLANLACRCRCRVGRGCIGRWCATGASTRPGDDANVPTTDAGNAAGRCSCGRWT